MTVREFVRWAAREVAENPQVAEYQFARGMCDPICDHLDREISFDMPEEHLAEPEDYDDDERGPDGN